MYPVESMENINVRPSHHYDTYQFLTSRAVHKGKSLDINPAGSGEKEVWRGLDACCENRSFGPRRSPASLAISRQKSDYFTKHLPRNGKLLTYTAANCSMSMILGFKRIGGILPFSLEQISIYVWWVK